MKKFLESLDFKDFAIFMTSVVVLNTARLFEVPSFVYGMLLGAVMVIYGTYNYYVGFKAGIEAQVEAVLNDSQMNCELAKAAAQALERAGALREEAKRTLQATKEAAK